jgi:hypothetical protein
MRARAATFRLLVSGRIIQKPLLLGATALMLAVVGCGRGSVNSFEEENAQHGALAGAPAAVAPEDSRPDNEYPLTESAWGQGESQGTISLSHSFGVLRPRSKAVHSFKVTNDTAAAWTLKEVSRNCNCTVASISKNPVGPGESAEIVVSYRAPSKYSDERRTLEMRFVESPSPLIRLEVQAAIRPPVVLSRDQLRFAGRKRNYHSEAIVQVDNFSDEDWANLLVRSDAPWASGAATLLESGPQGAGPRQVWQLRVVADAQGLEAGAHSARLRLRCGKEETWLPVSLERSGPVTAIPSQMFFSTFNSERRSTCSVVLRCLDEPAAEVARKLTVDHDLEGWLTLSIAAKSRDTLILKGELVIPGPVATVKGSLRLDLNDDEGTLIKLPVSALR